IGITYGKVDNNLPPPEKVLGLLDSLKITKVRIYDTNPQILTAFANSNVELIIIVENQMLTVLMDPQQAYQWVNTHIKPYFPYPQQAYQWVNTHINPYFPSTCGLRQGCRGQWHMMCTCGLRQGQLPSISGAS
ncbi:Glyco_hydro_17 domain-containing protein, partial [Cephalotus follicularis]